MKEKHIFNVPIYRCQIEKFKEEEKIERQKLYDYFYKCNRDLIEEDGYDINPMVNRSMVEKEKIWKYNEIVGFIDVFIWSKQIRGNLYYIQAKRVNRNAKNRTLKYYGKSFEIINIENKTSNEIFQKLINRLSNLTKESIMLKNRYIDISTIETLGLYINWKKLVEDSN